MDRARWIDRARLALLVGRPRQAEEPVRLRLEGRNRDRPKPGTVLQALAADRRVDVGRAETGVERLNPWRPFNRSDLCPTVSTSSRFSSR
jgi:hypothetical protein